jgi:glutamyl-tRNA(Gln) amidotransferase subunit E
LISKKKISKDSLLNVFVDTAKGKNVKDAAKNYFMLSDAQLKKEIKKIKAANKNLAENALIGKVMSVLRGKADSKKIIELIKA